MFAYCAPHTSDTPSSLVEPNILYIPGEMQDRPLARTSASCVPLKQRDTSRAWMKNLSDNNDRDDRTQIRFSVDVPTHSRLTTADTRKRSLFAARYFLTLIAWPLFVCLPLGLAIRRRADNLTSAFVSIPRSRLSHLHENSGRRRKRGL